MKKSVSCCVALNGSPQGGATKTVKKSKTARNDMLQHVNDGDDSQLCDGRQCISDGMREHRRSLRTGSCHTSPSPSRRREIEEQGGEVWWETCRLAIGANASVLESVGLSSLRTSSSLKDAYVRPTQNLCWVPMKERAIENVQPDSGDE